MLRRRKAKTADWENSNVFFRSGSRSPNLRLFEKKKTVFLTIMGGKATFKRPKMVSEAIFLTNYWGYMVYLVNKCCLGFS